ncbi:MAG TPA: pyridoxamine 5'-phosphate oxidase family protein [Gaiellales bacterium]
MAAITTEAQLRALHAAPKERTLRKELDRLDPHCRRFIALSPFLVMATADADGRQDATPRGGDPGFVEVADEHTLLLPDRPGNNRLDSLSNLTERPDIGLLFMIPGVDETLRVNGIAELRTDPDLVERFQVGRRPPAVVVRVTVRQAYLHCAKALMRSRLWDPDARIDRGELPTLGEMLRDQIGSGEAEPQAAMVERYRGELY